MSEMAQTTRVPKLTLGWRLKMALGDMPVQAMADHLGHSSVATTQRYVLLDPGRLRAVAATAA